MRTSILLVVVADIIDGLVTIYFTISYKKTDFDQGTNWPPFIHRFHTAKQGNPNPP